jgi:hypothetical protein
MRVVHRVRDLPRLALRIEVSDTFNDEPRRSLWSPVVIAHRQRRTFCQLDSKPFDISHGVRSEVAQIEIGYDAPFTVAHGRTVTTRSGVNAEHSLNRGAISADFSDAPRRNLR